MGGGLSFPLTQLPRERVVIVTGGNTGLGYEIAKWVAIMGATVIIGCRSEQRGMEAIGRMQEEYSELKAKKETHDLKEYDSLAVEYMNLDLASFASTKTFVEDFKKTGRSLHVLVCNAGIAMAPYRKTEDGFESMLQTNYLGHFMLTAKLLPLMLKSGDDLRIINMSSIAHTTCTFDLETMNYKDSPEDFPRYDYYGRTKLYQIMQAACMTRRLRRTPVTINSSHPGIVETEVNRNFNDMAFWRFFFWGSKTIGNTKTALEGAASVINGASNPQLRGISGQYWVNCKVGFTTHVARNKEKQEALWKKTLEYLKDHITEEELGFLEGTGLPTSFPV